jgi:hypothetical protein
LTATVGCLIGVVFAAPSTALAETPTPAASWNDEMLAMTTFALEKLNVGALVAAGALAKTNRHSCP